MKKFETLFDTFRNYFLLFSMPIVIVLCCLCGTFNIKLFGYLVFVILFLDFLFFQLLLMDLIHYIFNPENTEGC